MVRMNTKERGRSKIVCVKLKRSDRPLGNEGNCYRGELHDGIDCFVLMTVMVALWIDLRRKSLISERTSFLNILKEDHSCWFFT